MKTPVDVNSGSRSRADRVLAFTIQLLVLGASTTAFADRVVVLPPQGELDQVQLDELEEVIAEAVIAAGHLSVTEAGAIQVARDEIPTDPNEFQAIAEMQDAPWVLVPLVTPTADGPRITVRVFFLEQRRIEELETSLTEGQELETLREMFARMIRVEGMGDYDPDATREQREAEERARREAEEQARREAEERAAREAEEQAAREAEERARREADEAARAWDERERYDGAGHPILIQLGLGFRPILATGQSNADGGVLGAIEGRVGYALSSLPGLELRGGLDIVFGASSAFALHGGAVYLASPWVHPVHVGGGAEIGLFQAISGNRVPSFMFRASGVVSWHPTGNLYLEAAVPELMVLSANGGAVTFGMSVRLGVRL